MKTFVSDVNLRMKYVCVYVFIEKFNSYINNLKNFFVNLEQ